MTKRIQKQLMQQQQVYTTPFVPMQQMLYAQPIAAPIIEKQQVEEEKRSIDDDINMLTKTTNDEIGEMWSWVEQDLFSNRLEFEM